MAFGEVACEARRRVPAPRPPSRARARACACSGRRGGGTVLLPRRRARAALSFGELGGEAQRDDARRGEDVREVEQRRPPPPDAAPHRERAGHGWRAVHRVLAVPGAEQLFRDPRLARLVARRESIDAALGLDELAQQLLCGADPRCPLAEQRDDLALRARNRLGRGERCARAQQLLHARAVIKRGLRRRRDRLLRRARRASSR